jgi:hypothetical protein
MTHEWHYGADVKENEALSQGNHDHRVRQRRERARARARARVSE